MCDEHSHDANSSDQRDVDIQECVDHDLIKQCEHSMRNSTGILAWICFLGIGLSSINFVRRKSYTTFYILHALLAVLSLVFSVLHWDQTFSYLLPALVLWMSTSLPVCVETYLAPSVHVTEIESITADRPCVSISFKVSHSFQSAFQPGHYVFLGAKDISFMMLPLTLCHVPERKDEYRVIVRCIGPFTSDLRLSLISEKCKPNLKVQGLYGSTTQLSDVLKHERVMLIAGGVGVTTYISLLTTLQSIDHSTSVELHWICRDELLVEYIEREYLSHLKTQTPGFGVFIHMTSQKEYPQDQDLIEVLSFVADPTTAEATNSAFAAGTRLIENVKRSMLFACNSLMAISIVFFFGSEWQVKHNVPSRLWHPLMVSLAGFITLFGFFVVSKVNLKNHQWSRVAQEEEANENMSNIEIVKRQLEAPSERVVDPFDTTTTSSVPTQYVVARSSTRPEIPALFSSFRPNAVFVCGPKSLVSAVQEIPSWIEVYESSFEM